MVLVLQLCLGLAAAVAAPGGCAGSSANLAAVECTAWVSLYDGTGGATHWTNCSTYRLDPCGCRYSRGEWDYGVNCSEDDGHQHILKL
jgi:hypothetical protein